MTMDKWSHEQIARMLAGSNEAFSAYVNGVDAELGSEKYLKYSLPRIIYYRWHLPSPNYHQLVVQLCYQYFLILSLREIISAKVEHREPSEFNPKIHIPPATVSLGASSSPSQGFRNTPPPACWVPDKETKHCMLCSKKYTVVFRRHHCRRCGLCVCRFGRFVHTSYIPIIIHYRDSGSVLQKIIHVLS